jgi:predicted CoA-binding protein
VTTFRNPSVAAIRELLRTSHTIAVVGISDNPARPSFGVTTAMRDFGYRILPVNPALTQWQGIPTHPTLEAAVQALRPDERIDIVNVFRRPAQVGTLVDDCLRLGLHALWLQQGVINEPAAERAVAAGMTVVMDRCIYVDRASLRE